MTLLRRLIHAVRNPRPAALIGFALAVMIAAALLTSRRADEGSPDDDAERTPDEAAEPAGDPGP